MGLLIEWGTTLHNRMSLCVLVVRVALAPSRRIPTCRTYLTYLTFRTYHFIKTAPHWRVHHSLQPNFPWLAQADSVIGAVEMAHSLDGSSCRCTDQWDRRLDRPVPRRHRLAG